MLGSTAPRAEQPGHDKRTLHIVTIVNWLQAAVVVFALLFVATRKIDCTEGFLAPINLPIWLLTADTVLTLAVAIVMISARPSGDVGHRLLLGGLIAGAGAVLTFGAVLGRMTDICGN